MWIWRVSGSMTRESKRDTAADRGSQRVQLTFPGMTADPREAAASDTNLSELVIVHAGNPDDGCCGIWVGVPIATDEVITSPWAWIEPLWIPEATSGAAKTTTPSASLTPRHDELPEPEIVLEPVAKAHAEEQ